VNKDCVIFHLISFELSRPSQVRQLNEVISIA
jgi:hypothetical protein